MDIVLRFLLFLLGTGLGLIGLMLVMLSVGG